MSWYFRDEIIGVVVEVVDGILEYVVVEIVVFVVCFSR